MSTDAYPEWQLPVFGRLCRAADLAACLVSFRTHLEGASATPAETTREFFARLSEAGLTRLLDLAEAASSIPNEGRYPTFTVFTRSRAALGDVAWLARYRTPVRLDAPRVLADLATVLPAEDGAALLVEEQGGALVCLGIANTYSHLLLPTASGPPTGATGLAVVVDGPGRVRVKEMALDLQLAGAAIRSNASVYESPLANRWLEEVREESFRRCRAGAPRLVETHHTYGWNTVVVPVWKEVFLQVGALHHGGALTVVPDPTSPLLDVRFALEPISLLDEIDAYLILFSAVRECPSPSTPQSAELATRHARLFARARAVANLTAIDGCVVFDRSLTLHGYGCKISADAEAAASTVRFMNQLSGEERPETDVSERLGTRHRSAFRLCKAVPHSLAFVVSQDGGLRIFGSDERSVWLEEGIATS